MLLVWDAEQNYEKAAHWFSQAAAMDHKYAQYSLAGLYRRGRGWSKMIYGRFLYI